MDKKYHYFYKITNRINHKYYYGIHSTNNLDDGYMGSGTSLHKAYEKYGMENFVKEILKFFPTRKDASDYERDIVNESLIKNNECYNIRLGGDNGTTTGTATVKDIRGNVYQVPINDERILSGELVGVTKGYVTAKDSQGNLYFIPIDDERYLSGELVHNQKGFVKVFDKNNNKFSVPIDDERYLSGELKALNIGKVLVKDKDNKCYMVPINDSRIQDGELKLFWVGRSHKNETIKKLKQTLANIQHQSGEKNSQYGTCWITKQNINKKIKKEELVEYQKHGWVLGRVIRHKK